MLFLMFDYAMRKLGRKYAFVDTFGVVAFYRYYVFFLEKHVADSWVEKYLPNLFVHHFVGESSQQWVDAEIAHTHPWNTLSIVLKGGYVEEENYNKETKETIAPAIVLRSWKTSHRFVKMTPNTWTLFFHGIRKGKWAFDLRVHEVICPTCKEYNGGVCANTGRTGLEEFTYSVEIKNSSADSKKWREVTWMKCDNEFEQILNTRKKTLAKAKIATPETFNERYEMYKTVLVKELASKKTATTV